MGRSKRVWQKTPIATAGLIINYRTPRVQNCKRSRLLTYYTSAINKLVVLTVDRTIRRLSRAPPIRDNLPKVFFVSARNCSSLPPPSGRVRRRECRPGRLSFTRRSLSTQSRSANICRVRSRYITTSRVRILRE